MSVDQRLRAGLRADDDPGSFSVDDALAAVNEGAHRRAARRRMAQVSAVVAAVVVVSALSVVRPWERPGTTADRNGATEPTQSQISPDQPLESPIDGRWTTGPLTMAQVLDKITASGHGPWNDKLEAAWDAPKTFTLNLTLLDGDALLLMVDGRGRSKVMDAQTFIVDGDLMSMHPDDIPDAVNAYWWDLRGDRLFLGFVLSTEGRTDGIPGEVQQRALYSSAWFTRVGE